MGIHAGDQGASSSAQGRSEEQDKKTLIAHIRHELRTSLTAVIGYGEFLLESVSPTSPADLARPLEDVKGAGDTMLALVDSELDAFRIEALDSDALPRILRDLSDACSGPVGTIAAACRVVISIAEREGMYDAIPVVCKIQAAGDMLGNLLRTYSREGSSGSLAAATPVSFKPPPSSDGRLAASKGRDRPGRVLIVDDNSINRDLLRQWLERQGHTIEEASGGLLGLELIRSRNYDVILLDFRMPDLNGVEVLQILDDEGRLGKVPIVMLSASGEMEGVVQCIERGADDYLLKPFNSVLLRARIRLSMELRRHRELESEYAAAVKREKSRSSGG